MSFYYETLSVADSEKLNDYFQFGEGKKFQDDTNALKLTGAASIGLNKFKLVNSNYDDISLVVKGKNSGQNENIVLSSHLQQFVDQKVRPSGGSYRSYTYSGGRFDTYYDQDLSPVLLPRNKAITFSVEELLSPQGLTDTGCSIFYLQRTDDDGNTLDEINLGEDISNSEESVYQTNLINAAFNDVKTIKPEKE